MFVIGINVVLYLVKTFKRQNGIICYHPTGINALCVSEIKLSRRGRNLLTKHLEITLYTTLHRVIGLKLMHLKCTYFSKPFAHCFDLESHHTSIKTAEFDAVFSKVSFLAIFAGNKFEEKYHVSFPSGGATWAFGSSKRGQEGQKAVGGARTPLGRATW